MDNEKMTATHTDEVRSWTVVLRQGKPVLLPTKWQPGYTPAHKATELEALKYAAQVRLDQITGIQLELNILGILALDYDENAIANDESGLKEDDRMPLGYGIPDIQEETDEEFRVRQEARDRAALNND